MPGPAPYPPTLGVILAGGLARRMGGGDKPLLNLGGSRLLDRVAGRLAPQCEGLIVNANGDPARFESLKLPVVPDSIPDHAGPLAGILAALEWTSAHRPEIAWIVSVPGDTPFIPRNLVSRLHEAREAAKQPLACAATGERVHYAVGLWPVRLRQDLHRAIVEQKLRRLGDWVRLHGDGRACWPSEPLDPFFNINTPDDLNAAEALARLGSIP